jgi:hypothetical protein
MQLIDAHLTSANGVTAYKPTHGFAGLQLVKVFKCGLCDQEDEVREDIQ